MKLRVRRWACLLVLAAVSPLALSQDSQNTAKDPADDVKLPNGKSQRDEILKLEHADNVKDATRLVEMTQELKADIENNDRFVLSMSTLKKTDDIEKLVKKIRSRLRH